MNSTTPHQTVPTPRLRLYGADSVPWEIKMVVPEEDARALQRDLSAALEESARLKRQAVDSQSLHGLKIEYHADDNRFYAYAEDGTFKWSGEATYNVWRCVRFEQELHSATTSRDEALAAGGEMRAILSPLVYSEKCAFKPSEIGSCINSDFTRDRWCGSCIRLERIRKALSTTCGQGWRSPEEVRTACEIAGRNGALIQSEEVARLRAEVERLKEFEKSYHEANGWNDTSDNLEDWIRNLVPEITQCQLSERSVIQQVVDMREGRDTALQKARELEERVRVLEEKESLMFQELNAYVAVYGMPANGAAQERIWQALAKPASVPAGQISPDPETAAAPADGSRTP